MIIVYNPLILFEAAVAGGLSFASSKIFTKIPKTADTMVFVTILIALDFSYRYWLLRKKSSPAPPIGSPITPTEPSGDWAWLISPKGAHFLMVPAWAIGIIYGSFSFVL